MTTSNNTNIFGNCAHCGQSLDDGHKCPADYDESEIVQILDDCTDDKRIHQLNPLWERVTANG